MAEQSHPAESVRAMLCESARVKQELAAQASGAIAQAASLLVDAFRSGRKRGQFDGHASLTIGVRVDIHIASAPPYADQHQALIGDNSKKPRQELGITVILIQMLKGFKARLLNFVLRVAAIAQYEGSNIDAGSMVSAYQNPECLSVSSAGLGHQFRVFV